MGRMRRVLSAVAVALAITSCTGPVEDVDPEPTMTHRASPRSSVSPTVSAVPPEPGTVPPSWLGRRPLPRAANGLGEIRPTPPELRNRRFTLVDQLEPLPGAGFASRIEEVPAEVLARSSWDPKCPVEADELRWVRLTFWGFDGRRHTGELLVNKDSAGAMVRVFGQLYAARFPLEEMRITRADEIDAEPTGDGNNTSAFTCKPLRGSTTWSEHAKGRAVDVNPFQNPYVKGDALIPELASAYTDRARRDPGVIHPGDAVTQAFASVGWSWGGNWQHSKDYMHFSANGR